MKAELLSVGTELLMGQIVNTNAAYISKRLLDVGLGVYYHTVVGDNPQRLRDCLGIAMNRCEIVIMIGGLGPTQDDLTKETVASLLGVKLVLDEESVENIKGYFFRLGTEMVESNLRQAYFPEGSIILRNENGTAPGCIIDTGKNILVLLPGPPDEMVPMFEKHVIPFFKERSDIFLKSKFINIAGLGESMVEYKLISLIDGQTNPTFATYAKEGVITLRVTVSVPKNIPEYEAEADRLLLQSVSDVHDKLGDHIFSTDNESLAEVVYKLFLKNKMTFSLAESCTGGLIASKITSIPGVSDVFNMSVVTYSNESKEKLLGVRAQTLHDFGAVSRETAIEMAQGIRRASGSDVGLSVTGIAGPGGGSREKPVGLVFIAIDGSKGCFCRKCNFSGSRDRIRNLAATTALDMLRRSV